MGSANSLTFHTLKAQNQKQSNVLSKSTTIREKKLYARKSKHIPLDEIQIDNFLYIVFIHFCFFFSSLSKFITLVNFFLTVNVHFISDEIQDIIIS